MMFNARMSASSWYRVEVQIGTESYFFTGSSDLSEAELLNVLSSGSFFCLNDLVYVDEQGDVHPWTEWDPECQPRIYLNGRLIISIMPLLGDPRRSKKSEGTILRLPGRPG